MVGETGSRIQLLPGLDIPYGYSHILLSQGEGICAAVPAVVRALVTI